MEGSEIMKITQTAYDRLQTEVLNVLAKYTDEQIAEHRQTVKFVKSQFVAFVWSIVHHTDNNTIAWLYSQGYNDNHIETVLKKILKKYQ